MLRKTPTLLLLATFGLACSARYEVGSMDPDGQGGSANAGGSSAAGTGNTGDVPGTGNTGSVGLVTSSACIARVTPEPVTGNLQPPIAVWQRVSKLIWGAEPHEPPSPFPAETSYAWTGQLVEQAFAQATQEHGAIPGATYVVQQLLETGDEPLMGDYDAQLAIDDNVLLEVLLQSSWAPDRAGMFSEPTWLTRRSNIPARGAGIANTLFGKMVPAPPPGVNRNIYSAELTERQAMELAVNNQPACAACHNLMNPLGYALGHFDHEGQYRDLDHDQEIDTTGSYDQNAGNPLEFDGIADFGAKAADSCDANQNIVDAVLRIALVDRSSDSQAREALIAAHHERVRSAYVMGGRSYLALVKAYAQSPLVLWQ